MTVLFAIAALAAAQVLDPTVAEALRAGRHAEVIERTQVLLRSAPRDAALWTARGLALAGLDKPGEALASFDKALAAQPRYVPALRGAADTAYRSRSPRGLGYVSQLLAVKPEETAAHAMAAVLRFESGDCGAALPHFETARDQVMPDALAASLFSQCLIGANRAAEAVAVLQRTRERNPASRDVPYNLAVAMSAAGRMSEAIGVLEAMPGPAPATRSLLAVLYARAGKLERALPMFEGAIAEAPNDERPYVDYGAVCTDHRNWQKAAEVAAIGLVRVPGSARLHSLRGVALFQLGRFNEASDAFESADKAEPRRAFGAAGQGLLLGEQGQPGQAAAALRQALARQPGDPRLQYLLADALQRSNSEPAAPRIAEARRLLEQCTAAWPKFAQAQATLGKLYRAAGRRQEALTRLRAALAADGGNRQALQQIILALRETGHTAEAAQLAQRLQQSLGSSR